MLADSFALCAAAQKLLESAKQAAEDAQAIDQTTQSLSIAEQLEAASEEEEQKVDAPIASNDELLHTEEIKQETSIDTPISTEEVKQEVLVQQQEESRGEEATPFDEPIETECNNEEQAAMTTQEASANDAAEAPISIDDVESAIDTSLLASEPEGSSASIAVACQLPSCLAMLDLSENLSLEVSELTHRYDMLQEEGARLFKQYEIKCAMLKATKTHNHAQQTYITQISAEHESLRAEYQELYNAYQELEGLYNAQAGAAATPEALTALETQLEATQAMCAALRKEANQVPALLDELATAEAGLEEAKEQHAMAAEKAQAQWDEESRAAATREDALRAQVAALTASLTAAEAQAQSQAQQSAGPSAEHQALMESHKRLQSQLASMEIKLDASESDLVASQNLAASRSEELETLRRTYEAQADSLVEQMSAKDDAFSQQLSEKNAALLEAEQTLAELSQQLQEQKLMVGSTSSQLQSMTAQSAAQATQIAQAATHHASLSAQLAAAQAICESLRTDAKQLPALKEALSKSTLESEQRAAELKATAAAAALVEQDLRAQIASLQSQMEEQTREQLAEMVEAAQEADRAVEAKQQELLSVNHALQVSQAECELMHKELESTEAKNLDLVAQIEQQAAQIAALQTSEAATSAELAATRTDLSASLAQTRSDLASAQSMVDSQSLKLVSLQSSYTEAVANHQSDLKAFGAHEVEMGREIAASRDEVAAWSRKYKESKKRVEELSEALHRVEVDLAEAESKLASAATAGAGAHASKQQLSELQRDSERQAEQILRLRSENATLEGRLSATTAVAASEASKLRDRASRAEKELESLRATASTSTVQLVQNQLNLVSTQLSAAKTTVEELRADKEELMAQIEMLMEAQQQSNGTGGNAADAAEISSLSSQVASLTRHNSELKAYLVKFKASGEEKMAALHGDHQRLLQLSAQLVSTLAQKGMVKKGGEGADAELYAQVQALALTIRNAQKAQQQKAAAQANRQA